MSQSRPGFRAVLGMILATATMFMNVGDSAAQTTCVGFSAFASLTAQQFTTLQMRLSPVAGLTDKIPPALAFTYFSNTLDPSKFVACEASGVSYGSDGVNPLTFAASTSELQAVITNLATIPAVTAGGVSPTPWYSFEMYESQPHPIGFEVVLDQTSAGLVFTALFNSFPNQPQALKAINIMACGTGFLPPGTPANVSASVAVALQGVRLNRATGTYVGNLQVTNNSGGPLSTPLSIVLDVSGHAVFLANPDGITCATSPVGRGFVNVVSPPAAGTSVNIPVAFLNPDVEPIKFNQVIVLSGPGSR
jgi:hypothetical protein